MQTIKKYPLVILFLSIIFTAALLRSTIVIVGPISEIIIFDLKISATNFGLITTIPLIVFALSSASIPFIASKGGLINTLIGGLLLIMIGSLLRSIESYNILLIGTIFVGFGISISNVLIPALIKEYAGEHRAIFTSSYLCMQNIMASVASGIAFFIAINVSWSFLMLIWIVPAIIAITLWFKYKKDTKATNSSKNLSFAAWSIIKSLLKSKYAWALSMIMGLQSVLYYTSVTWLPKIALDNEFSQEFISFLMISFQLSPLPALFLVPILVKKIKQDSYMVLLAGIIILIGAVLLRMTQSESLFLFATVLVSLGTGISFAWVVAIITNRSKDSQQASSLSAMSQTIGYSLAAIGPWLGGLLVDLTSDSKMITIFMLIIGLVLMVTSIYLYLTRHKFSLA